MSNIRTIEDILDSVSVTHKFDKDKLIFLNTSDVLKGKILIDDYMDVGVLKGQAKKTIKNGDILFSEIRPKNKRYAFVNVSNPEDYVVSTKLMVLRNKTKDVLTKYIYYFLTYEGILNYLQMRAENRIGSFPQITYDILKELKVNVPETNVQQKIVDILTVLDAKIELNQRITAELESMAKTLYDYWFVQFDFPNKTGKPYKFSGGKTVWNETLKRHIPSGWEIAELGNILSLEYGKPLKNEERSGIGYPVLGSNGIVGYHNEFLVEGPGIVVGRKGTAGAVVWVEDNFYPIDTTFYVKDKLGINNLYFHYFLLLRSSIKKIESGSAVPGLNRNSVYSIKVAIPQIDIIQNFNKIVDPFFSQIKVCNREIQTLVELRDWLLPMLMNGQVKVKKSETPIT